MRAALPLVAVLLFGRCSNELAPTALATVSLKAAGTWPDTLPVAAIATVLVDVVRGGADISGVTLEWSSSDSSVVQVTTPDTGATPSQAERLAIGQRAIITTHGAGTANIIVRLNRPGFAPAQLSAPIVVQQQNWPALLTVTGTDTVGVSLTHADPAVLGTVSYSWQSSDPSVLQATALASDPTRAQLTARANGPAQVLLTVSGALLGHVTFQEPLLVGTAQIVQKSPWPAVLPVTDTTRLAVTVQDAAGNPWPGVKVSWSSTNLSAFTVDSAGLVTGLSRGGGEVVASVGSAPFQVVQLRAQLQVVQKWSTVSAGGDHSCAIAALDGTGYCWGSNGQGELGLGLDPITLGQSSQPRLIATSQKFAELKAGESHSCGRVGATDLLCWGSRERGQVGDGPCVANGMGTVCFPTAPAPVAIVTGGMLGTQQIHLDQLALGGTFTCIIDVNGGTGSFASRKVRCWGTADQNGMGIVFASTADSAQVLTPGLGPSANIVDVAAGGAHLCVRTDDIWWVDCMGINDHGQLGNGTVANPPGIPSAFTIVGGNPASPGGDGYPTSGLSAGGSHTCALDAVGVLCWGANTSGQLGAAGGDEVYPTRVGISVTVSALSAGDQHTCALVVGGDVWCWGSNSNGQLGRGTIGGTSSAPALVTGGLKFVSVTAGGSHTCGVTTDGSIYCWGANAFGQLGDGTQTDRGAPVRVTEPPQ